MGSKERRDRERQEIRIKILDAARELFSEFGYDAVTMRRIAEKIEYSPTAIYLHFKDKETLIRELCDADFMALAKVFPSIGTVVDPIDRLKQSGLAYIQFALTHPNHYRLMFMTLHPRPPFDPSESAIQKGNPEQDAYAFLKSAIAEAMAAGLLRPELQSVELVAQVMWGCVHGLVSLHITKANDPWVDWQPIEVAASVMIDAVMSGLGRGGR